MADASTAKICDQVALQASRESGVPVDVLRAITRTETGRTRNGVSEPWPWTVNMEGKGAWFETEDAARKYVFKHFKRGARSFDVGCFQINYKWHGEAFRSIDEMFDPLANARYAAKFLTKLYAEKGNWSDSAGAYHSRTPEYANRYKARFDTFRAKMTKAPMRLAQTSPRSFAPEKRIRNNTFPLLLGGQVSSGMGSLFPHSVSPAQSLIEKPSG